MRAQFEPSTCLDICPSPQGIDIAIEGNNSTTHLRVWKDT